MHKVIVERPRHGSRHDFRRRGRPLDPEDAPLRESTSRAFGHRTLNEHLAPLRRWLASQVGRPWNAVFSELSEHVRPTNTVQRHVLEHVADLVALHVTIVDGRPHAMRWGTLQPLRHRHGHALYVCPRTGLLRDEPRPRTHPDPDVRAGPHPDLVFECVHGCWFAVTLAPVTENVILDALLTSDLRRRFHPESDADRAHRLALTGGRHVFVASRRPLTRAELRRHGLRNRAHPRA